VLDTMTASEVAKYQGLTGHGLVHTWLQRGGIRPVGRQPGATGQNLYLTKLATPSGGPTAARRHQRWLGSVRLMPAGMTPEDPHPGRLPEQHIEG
jgi:hypothetical protein